MFPYLNELATTRDVVDIFLGYNASDRIRENEFADMKNMSSDKYPMLSPRKPRGLYRGGMVAPNGMIAKDNMICYVDNKELVIRYPKELDASKETQVVRFDGGLTDGVKQLVSMGAYVVIFPDKKYVNTIDVTDKGVLDNKWEVSEETVQLSLCQEDGTDYKNEDQEGGIEQADITADIKAPEDPFDGMYWVDTTVEESPMLKRWSKTASMWVAITTTYIKLKAKDIAKGFFDEDGVTISKADVEDINGIKTLIKCFRDEENNGKDDYVVIKGITATTSTINNLSIERTMPEVDFVCECGNRLWACKYGKAGDKFLNEIYACKLGDFKNWNCFEGLSTDSYAVSCGTDGPFTAAVAYGGRPTFFKENCMHVLYGNYPSEYQLANTVCRGVQQGCEKSLAIINEVLFYKSRAGIMYYDGSLPAQITDVFGNNSYDKAVGCGFKNKYYLSMRNLNSGLYEFLVFDVAKSLWHKEDNLQTLWMCAVRDNVYYVDATDISQIRRLFVHPLEQEIETYVEWEAVTGLLGLSSVDAKYISRLDVRAKIDAGAEFSVYIQYDDESVWKEVHTYRNTKESRAMYSLPVRTRRCDSFRLKFTGKGNVDIISVSKTIEQGSSLRMGNMRGV